MSIGSIYNPYEPSMSGEYSLKDKAKFEPFWKLSGFYYLGFNPIDLAIEKNLPIHNLQNHVIGLILPYPHGFDDQPFMGITRLDLRFLHLFNAGETPKTVSGEVDGMAFTNVEIPAHKRIVLINSSYD